MSRTPVSQSFGPLSLAGPLDDAVRPLPSGAAHRLPLGWVLALVTMALAVVLALAGCDTPRDGGFDPGDAPADEPTTDPDDPVSSDDPVTEPTHPTPGDPPPVAADLTVTVDATGEGAVTTFTLTCEPAGGDHPDADAACAAIAAAGGPAAFEPTPRDVACTEQWGGPQTATVEGTVDGETIRADFSRTNGCEISRWDALEALFGPGGLM